MERAAGERSRYHIYVDGRLACTVHEDLLVKHRLLKGELLDERLLDELVRDEERLKAYHAALSYVAWRSRSAQEIRAHLKRKKYPPEWIEESLQKLEAQGFVDDREFARRLTNYRIRQQKKGSRWVRQELLQKGVKPEDVGGALESVDEEAEYRAAAELARKRWKPGDDPVASVRKLAQYLLRRGFPSGTVRRVVREVSSQAREGFAGAEDE